MADWLESKIMFIEEMLPKARERLVTIAGDAPLLEAAKLLKAGTKTRDRVRSLGSFGRRDHQDRHRSANQQLSGSEFQNGRGIGDDV